VLYSSGATTNIVHWKPAGLGPTLAKSPVAPLLSDLFRS
jgi:hypothetical protein